MLSRFLWILNVVFTPQYLRYIVRQLKEEGRTFFGSLVFSRVEDVLLQNLNFKLLPTLPLCSSCSVVLLRGR